MPWDQERWNLIFKDCLAETKPVSQQQQAGNAVALRGEDVLQGVKGKTSTQGQGSIGVQ